MKTQPKPRPKHARIQRGTANASVAATDSAETGSPALRRILYCVFALSGLTGLVYEATWTRYLQLFLGHAAYAQVLVLSLYMGGMAIGALLTSRLSATRMKPLQGYAIVEGVLGVAALA